MMKKICAGLLLLGSAQHAFADDAKSQTFFSARPHFEWATPERVSMFREEIVNRADDCYGGALEIVAYGGRSTRCKELAKFFMPFGKTCLNVIEGKSTVPTSLDDANRSKDVEARHFNIETNQAATTTFQSRISFCPEQTVFGLGFAWKQAFWWCDDRPKAWLEVAFPVEHIRNKMCLRETVISDGGGVVNETGLDGAPRVGNMTDAFKQASWKYGKIDNKKCLSKWGVADVEVWIKWSSYYSECCRLDAMIGFVAPTGTKIDKCNAAYVFSPVVGNNHHWAFLLGYSTDVNIWECDNHSLRFATDGGGRIFACNDQIRSFDVKDKQWSRYMEVYSSQDQALTASTTLDPVVRLNSGTSGINVFTKCVRVSPRYSIDGNTALIYQYCGFTAEIGYNLFVREAERVCLKKNGWDDTLVAFKDFNGDGGTNLARNIRQNFQASVLAFSAADYQASTIHRSDLNLDSAAHPAVISNILYGNLGWQWDTCRFPVFIGVGGSYEFSKVNTTINRWTAWGKFGIAY